jgi:hypothetical protein
MTRLITLIVLALCLSTPASADPLKPAPADAETEYVLPEGFKVPLPAEAPLSIDEAEDVCKDWFRGRRNVRACQVIVTMQIQDQRECWAYDNIPSDWDADLDRLREGLQAQIDSQQDRIRELENEVVESRSRIVRLEHTD